MIGISISTKDFIAPASYAASQALRPENLFPIIGRSATNTVREHLFGLNASRSNALGGARTNFYATAARATHFDTVGDGVVISINQVGIAQRYFGGTIKPVHAKFLTIPARTEAYGKRAGEFAGLVVLWGRNGPYALAFGEKTFVQKTLSGGKKSGAVKTAQVASQRGAILFWLVKSVTQQPDPTVLPYEELVVERIKQDVAEVIQRAVARDQGRGNN